MAVKIKRETGSEREVRWLLRRARLHIRNLSQCRVPGAAALKRAELSVLLTSDRKIRKINKQWRGKDKPTDVLSFPLWDIPSLRALGKAAGKGPIGLWELGDVVISLDRARAQAKTHGLTLLQELDLLLAHGLLHLLGFDHEISPAEEKRMRRWERRLTGRRGLL